MEDKVVIKPWDGRIAWDVFEPRSDQSVRTEQFANNFEEDLGVA